VSSSWARTFKHFDYFLSQKCPSTAAYANFAMALQKLIYRHASVGVYIWSY